MPCTQEGIARLTSGNRREERGRKQGTARGRQRGANAVTSPAGDGAPVNAFLRMEPLRVKGVCPAALLFLKRSRCLLARTPDFNQGGLIIMLVLRRRTEEGLLIDGRIRVRILGIEGDSVKIGVEAPRDVEVYRTEVKEMLEKSLQARQESGKGA